MDVEFPALFFFGVQMFQNRAHGLLWSLLRAVCRWSLGYGQFAVVSLWSSPLPLPPRRLCLRAASLRRLTGKRNVLFMRMRAVRWADDGRDKDAVATLGDGSGSQQLDDQCNALDGAHRCLSPPCAVLSLPRFSKLQTVLKHNTYCTVADGR